MCFANASRGLQIKGTNFEYLSEGAYAAVFVDRMNNRVRKVFFRKDSAMGKASLESFLSETEAYQIASASDELRIYIPEYYGEVMRVVIVDKQGLDVSNEFCTDLVIELEFIPGVFQKISQAPDGEEVIALFRAHGIVGISDASVTSANGQVEKIIDIGVREIEPEW